MSEFIVSELRGGNVVLYTLPNSKKGTLYYRIRIPGEFNQYERKSTRTAVLRDAERIAEGRFDELVYRQRQGLTVFVKTFSELSEAYLIDLKHRLDMGEITSSKYQKDSGTLNSFLVPYFGKKKLDTITQADVTAYHIWRVKDWERRRKTKVDIIRKDGRRMRMNNIMIRKPSLESQVFHEGVLRQVLKFGVYNGFLRGSELPRIKPTTLPKSRRGSFTRDEWFTISRALWERENTRTFGHRLQGLHRRLDYHRHLIRDFVRFLAGTGLRPHEAMNLRFSDIEEFRHHDGKIYVLIHVREGVDETGERRTAKTGARDVVGMPRVRACLASLRANHPNLSPNSYLWVDQKNRRIGSFSKTFTNILTDYGMQRDDEGKLRSLYSIRHTYATFRISKTEIYLLAKNMGTSVSLIEKTYGHVIMKAKARELVSVRPLYK